MEEVEDDTDIYANLLDFNEGHDAIAESNKELVNQCTDLKKQVSELSAKVNCLEIVKERLETNLSSLIATAKLEMKRKDSLISELRQSVDNSRRQYRGQKFKHNSTRNSFTQTESFFTEGIQDIPQTDLPSHRHTIKTEDVLIEPKSEPEVPKINGPPCEENYKLTLFGRRLHEKLLNNNAKAVPQQQDTKTATNEKNSKECIVDSDKENGSRFDDSAVQNPPETAKRTKKDTYNSQDNSEHHWHPKEEHSSQGYTNYHSSDKKYSHQSSSWRYESYHRNSKREVDSHETFKHRRTDQKEYRDSRERSSSRENYFHNRRERSRYTETRYEKYRTDKYKYHHDRSKKHMDDDSSKHFAKEHEKFNKLAEDCQTSWTPKQKRSPVDIPAGVSRKREHSTDREREIHIRAKTLRPEKYHNSRSCEVNEAIDKSCAKKPRLDPVAEPQIKQQNDQISNCNKKDNSINEMRILPEKVVDLNKSVREEKTPSLNLTNNKEEKLKKRAAKNEEDRDTKKVTEAPTVTENSFSASCHTQDRKSNIVKDLPTSLDNVCIDEPNDEKNCNKQPDSRQTEDDKNIETKLSDDCTAHKELTAGSGQITEEQNHEQELENPCDKINNEKNRNKQPDSGQSEEDKNTETKLSDDCTVHKELTADSEQVTEKQNHEQELEKPCDKINTESINNVSRVNKKNLSTDNIIKSKPNNNGHTGDNAKAVSTTANKRRRVLRVVRSKTVQLTDVDASMTTIVSTLLEKSEARTNSEVNLSSKPRACKVQISYKDLLK